MLAFEILCCISLTRHKKDVGAVHVCADKKFNIPLVDNFPWEYVYCIYSWQHHHPVTTTHVVRELVQTQEGVTMSVLSLVVI